MSSRGSWSFVALAAAASTLVFSSGAVADRGGVPNGGREDRPELPPQAQPQDPPAAQEQPQDKAAPPGQERRPESAPAPPGQEVRTAPRPRRDANPQPAAPREANGRVDAPGQARAEEVRARPSQAPDDNGNGNGNGGNGGGQDKTTICHSTGSDTNGFVEITVANPALDAHRRHGDLVPAPAGGCPGGERSRERIDICHATGSDTNPYVLLEDMPMESLNGHGGHEGDIIPAPADGVCPTVEQPAGTLTNDIPASAFAPRSGTGGGGDPGEGGVLGVVEEGRGNDPAPASGVLGAVAEAPAQDSLPAGATGDPRSGGELPFTGLQLLALLALGAAALGAGWSMRHHGRVLPSVT